MPNRIVTESAKIEDSDKKSKTNAGGGNVQVLGVPALNLSTLKHVREYTHQQTTLLDGKSANDDKQQKGAQQPQRPTEAVEDNQWYHYATKLELNVKFLRK